ncbi:MAG: alpha/beta fold hydrolase [Actinomycetota bacterium]|nr:alpha/beta fold hydrolase [Actinomycetota bacterium]
MSLIRFDTSDGLSLEGEIRPAEGSPRGTAVLCHPHPRHGGSKDHPILWAIRNDLAAKRGITTLAFNFRGIMGSQGTYGGGEEETEDVRAALARVRRETSGPTILVGWSFGAWVALRYAVTDPSPAALVLVGYPIGSRATTSKRPMPELGELERAIMPVLFVGGDDDPFCPVEEMRHLAGWLPHAECMVMPHTGHFFERRERELATGIGEWVGRVLEPQP